MTSTIKLPNTSQFSQLSARRSQMLFDTPVRDTTANHFLMGMVEELGEIAGVFKRLHRGYNMRDDAKYLKKHPEYSGFSFDKRRDIWSREILKKLGSEAADLFIYLDLFCQASTLELMTEVVDKFDEVSNEMGEPGKDFVILKQDE